MTFVMQSPSPAASFSRFLLVEDIISSFSNHHMFHSSEACNHILSIWVLSEARPFFYFSTTATFYSTCSIFCHLHFINQLALFSFRSTQNENEDVRARNPIWESLADTNSERSELRLPLIFAYDLFTKKA